MLLRSAWSNWAAVLCAVLAASCSDGDPDPSPDSSGAACAPGSSQQAIVAGDEDDDDLGVASVNIIQAECTRAGDSICTGTLVGPRLVLTAAHCAIPPAPSLYGVLFGELGSAGEGPLGEGLEGSFFLVEAIRLHPDFDETTLDNDVAVLVLTSAPPVEPVRLVDSVSDDLVGQQARVVGFGLTGTVHSDRRKRSGTVVLESVDDEAFRYLPAPAMTCEGDSGGPVLLGEGEEQVLVGVTSRGDASCREYGTAVRADRIPASLLVP